MDEATMHPFWTLVKKADKTDAEKIAIVGIEFAFVSPKYSNMTQEQVYDALLADAPIFKL